MGYKVMQIGCDPKADSTVSLHGKQKVTTVLDLVRTRKNDFTLEDMVTVGYGGVVCVEAGGPTPGLGCAGRGIIAALEKLAEKGAYDVYKPDVVIYDVLGDVVCGGFAMPLRSGYARDVFIVTSGEKMALYAAANIALAIDNFKGRNYARLSGLIQNSRNVKDETQLVSEMAEELSVPVVGVIPRDGLIQLAEEKNTTVFAEFPESDLAETYRRLAKTIYDLAEEVEI
jgi:nitrogenase iron protein NifH